VLDHRIAHERMMPMQLNLMVLPVSAMPMNSRW